MITQFRIVTRFCITGHSRFADALRISALQDYVLAHLFSVILRCVFSGIVLLPNGPAYVDGVHAFTE